MTATRRISVALAALLFTQLVACAPREEATPVIVVSPRAKERIVLMDRLRHHGAPKRLLPHVTVEEVDDAELDETNAGDAESAPFDPENAAAPAARDAGAEGEPNR